MNKTQNIDQQTLMDTSDSKSSPLKPAQTSEKTRKRRNHYKMEQFLEFLNNLKSLEKSDKGGFTALKRASGTTLGQSPQATSAFYKILPYVEYNSKYESLYYLVATLYPLNKYEITGNFGETMQKVFEKVKSNSFETRFLRLLDVRIDPKDPESAQSSLQEFGHRLQQAIKIAASNMIGVDWYQFLSDLYDLSRDWEDTRRIQRDWAREFYRTFTPSPTHE